MNLTYKHRRADTNRMRFLLRSGMQPACLIILAMTSCTRETGVGQPAHESRATGLSDSETIAASNTLLGSGADFLEACEEALGGAAARDALNTGSFLLDMSGDMAMVGGPAMSARIHVQYIGSDREWREVRSGGGSLEASFIKNEHGLWIRTADGKETINPPIPSLSERGPMIVGLVQAFFEYRDLLTRVEVGESSSGLPHADVLEFYNGDILAARMYLDRETHLPMRYEQTTVEGIPLAKELNFSPTTTDYSEYKTFGPVVMPTRITSRQDERVIMDMTVLEANFESTPDDSVFEFPAE